MSGVDSLVERKAVASKGIFPSFNRILAMNTVIPSPSIPNDRVFGSFERLRPKSSANEAGSMVKSAPVSSKKRCSLYPRQVLTETGTMGSGMTPRSVGFSERGNSIDAGGTIGREELDRDIRTALRMFHEFFDKNAGFFCVHNHPSLVRCNVLSTITPLKDWIVDCSLHDEPKTIMGVKSCQ